MYDILFICRHCGVHLSADENDVGVALPCPQCAADIAVPPGDVLFECPECGKTLLASADSRHEHFQCPYCDLAVVVPDEGKSVPVSEHSKPAPAPVSETPAPQPEESVAPAAATDAETRQQRQFMATWGDYMAKAGLAEEDKNEETHSDQPQR